MRERIKEVVSGASATVVVRIYGDDLGELRSTAERVKAALADIPDVVDLKVETQALVPQIRIAPRAAELARHGLSAGDVRRQAATLVAGETVGEIYRDQKSFEVAVWGEPEIRDDRHALADLLIETPAGASVRLRDVADISILPAPNEIKREDGSRRIDVTLNVASGGDLGAVARAVETRVAKLEFARGYHPEVLGEYAALKASQTQLRLLGGLSLLGVLVLLRMAFGSTRLAALVALTLPFALLGGVAAVALSGGTLSLGSLVGFVTVLGIAARNGIMLVSHYQHLQTVEGVAFGDALVARGAQERLVPILMTALCAGLALLPLVFGGNLPGHEIEHPMALVILGGLISSTVLNLLLLPTLYRAFGEATRRADADTLAQRT